MAEIGDIFTAKPSGSLRDDALILASLSKPYLGRLIAAILCSAILAAINGAIAWLVKPALDAFFTDKSYTMLFLLPVGVFVLFCLRGVFSFCTNYLMNSVGAKIVRTLRREIYDRLLALPASFYTRTSSGSVVSKVLNDLGLLHSTVAFTIKDFFVEGGTVIVLAGVAISRKWDLAFISFVVIPLMLYGIGRLGSVMRRTTMATRKLISRVTTILHETLQGMKIIKGFTMEKEMSLRHEDALAEHYRNTMREVRIDEFSRLITEVLGGIGVAVIVFYGSYLVISDQITPGSFFSFVAAVLMIYTPLKRLSKVYNNFQQSRTVIERVKEILVVERERSGGTERELKGQITFDGVSFRYPGAAEDALKNINLSIRPGEIVALVGYSGAGKSTLVDLIAGFWQPTEGRIAFDGTNAEEIALSCLRGHIGLVTQDVILFNDSVKANILFGRPAATDEEVIEAARAAHAHEFITALPQGYDTPIGERGITLSGGQKQRLTVARAILRNPSILLLDEATSSLDAESEQKVQEALEKLMVNRTTVVIAHRLSTVQKASRIVVMSKGGIVQEGTHEELVAQVGLYQELHALQFAPAANSAATSA